MFKIRNQTREISVISLIICVLTGLQLLIFFDNRSPLQSLSRIALLLPYANIIRNIHFWSSQILLISILLEIYNEFRIRFKISSPGIKSSYGPAIVLAIAFEISMTGFFLREDSLSIQLHQLTGSLLNFIPAIGGVLKDFFTGKENDSWLVLVRHISFASALLFIIGFEYFRKRRINLTITLTVLVMTFATGLFFNVNIIDSANQRLFEANINSFSIPNSLRSLNKPIILGRREGCIYCHENVKGLAAGHNPDSIGCYSCHLGYPYSLDKHTAHNGMILIPGNMSSINKTCGTVSCHPDIASRVYGSLMNTMSGVVTVDKYAFGESNTLSASSDIKTIGHSPSEKHLRNLCASCHLNKEKTEFGEVNDSSRGGGCLACHLNYTNEAQREITDNKGQLHRFHSGLNLKVTDDHCFGCHSRSGRISTNYEGWFETQLKPENVKGIEGYRTLSDDRVFEKHESDIHFEKGMQCIDCHLSYELMGDGGAYFHKEDQVKIQCTDCHSNTFNNTISGNDLDFEAKKILKLRGISFEKLNFLKSFKAGYALTNTFFDSSRGNPILLTKIGSNVLPLKKPASECSRGKAHERLSCSSCHTSAVSQCIGCHTGYKSENTSYDLLDDKDVKGEWVESNSNIFNELPTLGIRTVDNGDGTSKTEIITFAPGMVLTIDNGNGKKIFRRLFAPVEAHNIRREVRSCKSCHNNPVALGYGRGELVFKKSGQSGNWTFTPSLDLEKIDALPMDAWIGFLSEPSGNNSTRENTRPFNLEEQKRILIVGACLTCHDENSAVIKQSLIDFDKAVKKMSNKCKEPF